MTRSPIELFWTAKNNITDVCSTDDSADFVDFTDFTDFADFADFADFPDCADFFILFFCQNIFLKDKSHSIDFTLSQFLILHISTNLRC